MGVFLAGDLVIWVSVSRFESRYGARGKRLEEREDDGSFSLWNSHLAEERKRSKMIGRRHAEMGTMPIHY